MTENQYQPSTFYFKALDWISLTWKGWVTIFLLVLFLSWLAKPSIDDAFLHGTMQNLLLVFVGIALIITILNIFEIRRILKYRPYLDTSLKFRAEILAGLSIFSFFAQFSQIGSTLDRLSPGERLTQVPIIAEQIYSTSGCAKSMLSPLCRNLEKDLLRLEFYVAIRSEADVDNTIFRLKSKLSSTMQPVVSSSQLFKYLDGLSRSGNKITWIILLVPIFTLLFSSIAISTKIALAWPIKKLPIVFPDEKNNTPDQNLKIFSAERNIEVSGIIKVKKSFTVDLSMPATALAIAALLFCARRAIAKIRYTEEN